MNTEQKSETVALGLNQLMKQQWRKKNGGKKQSDREAKFYQ